MNESTLSNHHSDHSISNVASNKDLPADIAVHKGSAKAGALVFAVFTNLGAVAVIGNGSG
jgi:hypothetical protein